MIKKIKCLIINQKWKEGSRYNIKWKKKIYEQTKIMMAKS